MDILGHPALLIFILLSPSSLLDIINPRSPLAVLFLTTLRHLRTRLACYRSEGAGRLTSVGALDRAFNLFVGPPDISPSAAKRTISEIS